ncbi:PstS family phosphate ABC transporter substrate-binding protein [Flavobacterium aquicola]|uniref:Phosphate transport system substrate-binding protein n=1 Tax=Flavobacterium aquicola TaxID=1682742 RepID=A0A3E0EK80_9FLAO|nr:substrate-binding domain-containing protein [Flavobacterium aquicola]REG98654.1 phosphate transport system substrate-binding protein [Flavobacterium aquicola]
MKTHRKMLLPLIVLIITAITPQRTKAQDLSGSISISGAFALYPITVKWAEEFKKAHPKVKIDIQAGGAGKGITDVLSKVTDIGLVSRDLNNAELKKKAFAIAVTKDAVIPTISAASPYKAVLYKRGIKKEALNNIFITGKYKTWNALGFKNTAAIHVYTRSDAAGAAETWAHYFGKKQEDLQGVAVFGDPGLAEAVKRDPSGLGFNNIVYIYDTKTNKPTNGLVPVPIDLNNNGKLDPDENFYNDIDQLIAAIVAGKYPSPPARDLYFVTNGKPNNPIVKAFLKYILTDGQKYVTEAGYIKLSKDKLKKELDKAK